MRAALLFTCLLGGCLFVGDVNQRPSVQLNVETGDSFTLGQEINVYAYYQDDQDGTTGKLTIYDKDDPQTPTTACVTQSPTAGGWIVKVWDPGIYVLKVIPTDVYGAAGSSASATITIDDQGPSLNGAVLQEGSAAVACGANWLSSGPIPIVLTSPADNPDADIEPRPSFCTKQAAPTTTYTWSLSSQVTSGGTLGLATTNGMKNATCPAAPMSAALTEANAIESSMDTLSPTICLYPDPNVSSGKASTYGVQLVVSTKAGSASPVSITVPVIGDAPACFDGSYPIAGAYVLPSDQTTGFDVVGIDDVSPASALEYTWTLTRADGTSTVVQAATDGGDGGAHLSLDPEAIGVSVGESVQLRAEVVEPDGTFTCDDADDSCAVTSCVVGGNTCPRRITWSLEFR